MGRSSRAARDWALARRAREIKTPEFIWNEEDFSTPAQPPLVLRAAE
jgi:multidrug efflux pump